MTARPLLATEPNRRSTAGTGQPHRCPAAYSASIAITERLTKADRERAGRQPPVTVSTVRSINDPYLHRGDALSARNIFEKGLKVYDRLVAYSGDAEP